jgi:hypothetical protein
MTPDERFAALAQLLAGSLDVSSRGFGAGTLKVNNRIFALLSREKLVVKLPRKRVDELLAAGVGERFDPGHGRLQKEWLALAADDWEPLAREAQAYVASR